jgi:hypothetical protein
MRHARLALAATVTLTASTAHAFVAQGHRVIESQAYKLLGRQGCDDGAGHTIPGEQVLRELMAAGLLDAPACPGGPSDCASRLVSDPLSWWPAPHSDEPDLVLARQFSREGQCFHFMAMSSDENVADGVAASSSECRDPSGGGVEHVSCGLVCSAYNSCIETITTLAFNVSWADPATARSSHEGLYELMHAVADSYSRAHVEREPDSGRIHFLRVWQPIAVSPLSDATKITRHAAPSDDRDDDYVDRFGTRDGHLCTYYENLPYGVPEACLTTEVRQAVAATKELLCDVHAMRGEHPRRAFDASESARSHTTRMLGSPRWAAFLAKYFPHAHAQMCSAAEYRGRQEREHVPRVIVGYSTNYTFGNDILRNEVGLRIFSEGEVFEPAVVRANLGFGMLRSPVFHSVDASGVTDEPYLWNSIDVLLPVGDIFTIGTTPIDYEIGLARSTATFDVFARLLRLEISPVGALRGTWFSVTGPAEYYFLENVAHWSVGLAFGGVIEQTRGEPLPATATPLAVPPTGAQSLPDPWDVEPRYAGFSKDIDVLAGTTVPAVTSTSNGGTAAFRSAVQLVFGKHNPWGRINRTAWSLGLEESIQAPSQPGTTSFGGAFTVGGRLYVLGPVAAMVEAAAQVEREGASATAPADSPTGLHGSIEGRWGALASFGAVDVVLEGPSFTTRDGPVRRDQLATILLGFDAAGWR